MVYDLIIIGGGPAGASAAVYASRKRLNTLMLVAEWGGQSNVSEQIYNWIGTTALSGAELADNFKKHVLANATEKDTLKVKDGEKVLTVEKEGEIFKVKTETGEEFQSKTILITSGSGRRKLPALGADKFENKGVTYCASCDGPLFSGMDVAVAGGGKAGFWTAAQPPAFFNFGTLFPPSGFFFPH